MEITVDTNDGILTFTLSGRMDGYGSERVLEEIQNSLRDSDRAVIFDLGDVDYISSAGLRVFQEMYRKMKERKGIVALCHVQEFVLKVLKMGGFLDALSLYETKEQARNALQEFSVQEKDKPSGFFKVEELDKGRTTLHVLGSYSDIYQGPLSIDNIQKVPYISGGYRIGVGAVGSTKEQVRDLLGEMVEINEAFMWLPADGNKIPDYFTRDIMQTGDIQRFSIFQVTMEGPFHYLLTLNHDGTKGVPLNSIFEEIFSFAKSTIPDFNGVCAVSLKATIDGLCSSDINSSLIQAAETVKPSDSSPDSHHSLYYAGIKKSLLDMVSEDNLEPMYRGETLVAFGYGVDLQTAIEKSSEEEIKRISAMPTPMQSSPQFINLSGAVVKNIPWESPLDPGVLLSEAMDTTNLTAFHHVLGVTTVRSAEIRVAVVSSQKPA